MSCLGFLLYVTGTLSLETLDPKTPNSETFKWMLQSYEELSFRVPFISEP